MNFAFPALVLLVLSLPGIIFSAQSTSVPHVRERRSVADELAHSLFYSATIHAIWSGILSAFLLPPLQVQIDLQALILLLMGKFGDKDALLQGTIDSVITYPWHIFAYLLSANAIAFFAGKICRHFRLPPEPEYTPPESKWHEKLRRKLKKTPENAFRYVVSWFDEDHNVEKWHRWNYDFYSDDADITIPVIATVVDCGTKSFLYVGILEDVVPDREGNPDRFVLSGALRRPIDNDDAELYEIEGHRFIIRASEMITLNVWFWGTDDEELLVAETAIAAGDNNPSPEPATD